MSANLEKVKNFSPPRLATLNRLTSVLSSGWKKSGQLGWMSKRKSLNRSGTLNHIINIQEREIKSKIIESLIIKSLTVVAAVQNDWWWAKINLIPFLITVWICHTCELWFVWYTMSIFWQTCRLRGNKLCL